MRDLISLQKSAVLLLLGCSAASPQPLQANTADEIHPLLAEEAIAIQKDLIQNRPYSLNRNSIVKQTIVLPESYGEPSEAIPPWWSPKRGNQLSQFLALALQKYPGLKVRKAPTWDQIILNSEIRTKETTQSKTSRLNPLMASFAEQNPAHVHLSFLDYSSVYLKPKKRGIGLGLISFTNKSCSVDSYLKSKLVVDNLASPSPSGDQLLTQSHDRVSQGGTSLSLNLGVAGVGGGNFETPKTDLKKLLLEHIADTAEGIYCIATNNMACLKFYSERVPFSHKNFKDKDIAKSTEC